MSEQSKPKRRKRRIVFWAGMVLVALAGMLAMLRQTGLSVLQQAIKEARDLGGPVTFEEVVAARPVPPDDRNAAVVVAAVTSAIDALKMYDTDTPIAGKADSSPLGQRWPEALQQNAHALLGQGAAPLAQFDRLIGLEGGVFAISASQSSSFDAILQTIGQHYAPLRACVRLKSLQTLSRVMDGDCSRLADDVSVLWCLSETADHSPMLIGRLVGMACEALAISVIEQACAIEQIEPQSLARIQQIIARVERANPMAASMRGERAFTMVMFDGARKGNAKINGMGLPNSLKSWALSVSGLMDRDQAASIRVYNTIIRNLESGQPLDAIAKADAQLNSASVLAVLTRTGMPSVLRSIELESRYLAQNRAARLALAAERFRLATGAFPAKLGDLVPKYIDAIPADPFKPQETIKMVARGNRIIFYGIGEDLSDDGGDVDYRQNAQPKDWGFTLLVPSARNQPAPASAPSDNADSQPASHTE